MSKTKVVFDSRIRKLLDETQEPLLHTLCYDELAEDHPMAYESIDCDMCKKSIHAFNNECMDTWIETSAGNFCTECINVNNFYYDMLLINYDHIYANILSLNKTYKYTFSKTFVFSKNKYNIYFHLFRMYLVFDEEIVAENFLMDLKDIHCIEESNFNYSRLPIERGL